MFEKRRVEQKIEKWIYKYLHTETPTERHRLHVPVTVIVEKSGNIEIESDSGFGITTGDLLAISKFFMDVYNGCCADGLMVLSTPEWEKQRREEYRKEEEEKNNESKE